MIITINPKEARELIADNQDNPEFRIIDVRTKEEFSVSHLKRAMNINFHDERFEEILDKLDKNKTYLVYCHSGSRCSNTAQIMENLGFKRVYSVIGWLFD